VSEAAALPNIVFIMADDMGYGDPGCYGAEKIATPHMDRLAAAGVRFTDAHSPSAVCSPSRYGVLTGRYCWRTALKRWVLGGLSGPLLEAGRPTVADLLKARGYATAAVGKWHVGLGWTDKDGRAVPMGPLGAQLPDCWAVDFSRPLTDGPNSHGFDYSFIIAGSLDMVPYCFIEDGRTVGIPRVEKHPYNPQQRRGLMVPGWDDAAVDTTFARKAVAFIEGCVRRRRQQPFFLYLTPSAPHRPCVPPDFARGASRAGPRGDMVAVVDWVVGEVTGALERLGIADNTLVIVTSDNGARLTCYDGEDYGHRSCGALRGQKADIWDGGHREPFIARWPARIAPGSTCDSPVCLVDLMATCAAAVGAELPAGAGEDSFNILPALVGERAGEGVRDAIVHHAGAGMFSLRQGEWKLICGLGSGGFSEPKVEQPVAGGPAGQLYNMADDPAETRNLWQDKPDVVERLSAVLEAYGTSGRSRPGAD
jgi:arylsulfatase A-like enzyme